jgi:hypothetical protein
MRLAPGRAPAAASGKNEQAATAGAPDSLTSQWRLARRRNMLHTMRCTPSLLALALLALLAGSNPSPAEITYPWCAQYGSGNSGGGRNCGFWTYEQCMATLWGNGGYCEVNAMYRGPSPGMIPPPTEPRRPPRY